MLVLSEHFIGKKRNIETNWCTVVKRLGLRVSVAGGHNDYHRMTWTRTLTFSFFQDLSAVYTGAFRASPSAKQARSPNDKPTHGFVRPNRP